MRVRSQHFSLFFALMSGVVFAGGFQNASADEKAVNTNSYVDYLYLSSSNNGVDFDGRWSQSHAYFSLPASLAVEEWQGGVEPAETANRFRLNDEIKKVPFKIIKETNKEPIRDFATDECGPSPLNPDEIEKLVRVAARHYDVDEGLAVAIAWTESRFDQDRNSPAGARGAMQLMPDTAVRFDVRDVCDPAQNIEGGMKFLSFLLKEFKNPLLAAAAYNSGEQRIYEYGGVPPFKETVAYVAKVVNHQLGVELKTTKPKTANHNSPVAVAAGGNSGLIPVQKNRTFVAGVMHF